MTMGQEILYRLETTYESRQETGFVHKETLWNEFVNVGGVKSQSREVFFPCLKQSSLKGITVMCSKSAIYLLWKREREEIEKGS